MLLGSVQIVIPCRSLGILMSVSSHVCIKPKPALIPACLVEI